jgi:hypothetical protein
MRKSGSLKPFAPKLSTATAVHLARIENPAELVMEVGALRNRGISTELLAEARGCKDYEIRHLFRLHRNLSEATKGLLHEGRITLGQARVLASLSADLQAEHAKACVVERGETPKRKGKARPLSVRTLKDSIKGKETVQLPGVLPNKWADHYQDLGEQVSDQTGYPCSIRTDAGNESAGYLVLRFTSLDELEGVLNRLRIKREEL